MTESPPPPPPPGSPSEPPPGWGSAPGSSGWSEGFPAPPSAGPPGTPPAPPGWSPANQPPKRSGLAIAALVLGIVGLLLFILFIPALLALIFGLVAASTIKKQTVRERLGMARAGWIMGALSLAGGVAAWVAIALFVEDTKNALELDPGDCIEIDLNDNDTVSRVPVKECTETHDAEVVGVLQLNPDRDRDFPDSSFELNAEAYPQCVDEFADYTGRDVNDPDWEMDLDVTSIVTNESSWRSERGKAICVAFDLDGGELTESLRG